jgi:hypothetical protein
VREAFRGNARFASPCEAIATSPKEAVMLLILAVILLIVAIAGGVIIHPLLFALAIVALVLFFAGR